MKTPPFKYIVGVVCSHGAVDSKGVDKCLRHSVLFPGMHQFRWRWCAEWGLRETDHSHVDDVEVRDRIEHHVAKKYGFCIVKGQRQK